MEYDKDTLRKIGKILKMNQMGTIPSSEEGKFPNPLLSVWIYKDEIESLCKGDMPEEWE